MYAIPTIINVFPMTQLIIVSFLHKKPSFDKYSGIFWLLFLPIIYIILALIINIAGLAAIKHENMKQGSDEESNFTEEELNLMKISIILNFITVPIVTFVCCVHRNVLK